MDYNRQSIIDEVRKLVQDLSFELLESKIFHAGSRETLRCIVDSPNGGITVDQCVKVNRQIANFLEEEGILPDNFVIEVNSPGIDRSLKLEKDFLKIKGKQVGLWLKELFCDKDYIEGKICDVKDKKVFLEYKGDIVSVEIQNIKLGKEKIEIK